MYYIYNQKVNSINFSNDEIKSLLGEENEGLVSQEFSSGFNNNFVNILKKNTECDFYRINEPYLEKSNENIENLLRVKTEAIRNLINKFLLSENLSLLMSNGCSLYSGSKAINKGNETSYKDLLRNFKLPRNTNKKIVEVIQKELPDLRPEIILDKLYTILSYCENVLKDDKAKNSIDKLISEFKKEFINNFVLTVDYSKNYLHKALMKRLISRDQKLNKVNIFTLNYDLIIEKTVEELGIYINNGFMGFHNRVFLPSTYHMDMHINQSNGQKTFTKSINLFKLHGSISWKFDESKPPYGIAENQFNFNDISETKENIPDCIIYPVQSKKKYTLDLPYSEMFRQFIEIVNRPKSTLIIMGYSFLDEHVNDIITNALANPNFNLIVFSYNDENEQNASDYLKRLFKISRDDSRVTIFSGNFLGNFEYIVKYLIPYPHEDEPGKVILNTLKNLKGEDN